MGTYYILGAATKFKVDRVRSNCGTWRQPLQRPFGSEFKVSEADAALRAQNPKEIGNFKVPIECFQQVSCPRSYFLSSGAFNVFGANSRN
eukprot:5788009-Amphidinium_carterae.1